MDRSKKRIFSAKRLIAIFAFTIIVLALSTCGTVVAINDIFGGSHLMECKGPLPLTNIFPSRDIQVAASILLFLTIVYFVRRDLLSQNVPKYTCNETHRLIVRHMKVSQKLFDQLLLAFRKGILHSQIYSSIL